MELSEQAKHICDMIGIDNTNEMTNSFISSYFNKIIFIDTLQDIIDDPKWTLFKRENPLYLIVAYLLEVGDYSDGMDALLSLREDEKTYDKMDKYFQYLFCDSLHLLCLYEQAAFLLNGYGFSKGPSNYYFVDLLSHINKHLGHFSVASTIEEDVCKFGYQLPNGNIEVASWAKLRKLTIDYFIYLTNILKSPNAQCDQLYEFAQSFSEIDQTSLSSSQIMYKAAFNGLINPSESLRIINRCIQDMENKDARHKYNAYYIKGELLRIIGNYPEAFENYRKASGFMDNHLDINLVDQCSFSISILNALGFSTGQFLDTLKFFRNRIMAKKDEYMKKGEAAITAVQGKQSITNPHMNNESEFTSLLNSIVKRGDFNRNKDLLAKMASTIFIIL